MLSATMLLALVLAASAFSAASVLLLVALAIIDYRKEELW